MKSFSKIAASPILGKRIEHPLSEQDQSPCGICPASDHGAVFSKNGHAPAQNRGSFNRINVTVWLSAKEAATKLSCSTDTIERRAIPWQQDAVRYKIRFKFLVLDEGGEPTRRYFEPDLEALLLAPNVLPMPSRQRLIPRFVRAEVPRV